MNNALLEKECEPMPLSDRTAVINALRIIAEPGQVVELRALDAVTDKILRPQTVFGFFDNAEKLADAVGTIKSARGVYLTLNPVAPALLVRAPNQIRPAERGSATSDTDIQRRRWLPIDIDPMRPAGISSTSAEHKTALEQAVKVSNYLKGLGWPDPVLALSGNGVHLLYRIDLPAEDGGIVRRCLEALARRFDSKRVEVDRTVGNAGRILRLYGTRACKGQPTEERPHRMSRLSRVPNPLQIVHRVALQELANTAGPEDAGSKRSSPTNGPPFDVQAFIQEHGLDATGPEPWSSREGAGQRWVLKTSPMCGHHDGAAYIVELGNGALQAGCHHNSCAWTWADLRAHFGGGQTKAAEPLRARQPAGPLPQLRLPGDNVSVTTSAREAGGLLGATGRHFSRGGVLTAKRIDQDENPVLETVRPASFISVIEEVARPVKWSRGEKCWAPAVVTKSAAEAILCAEPFQSALPCIRGLTRCPVLIERDGQIVEVAEYDRPSGIYAGGRRAEEVPLKNAKELLGSLLNDFLFASPSDRSRAMAALITPALVFGGLLPGRASAILVEADDSQAGKGYFCRLVAAVYADIPATVTQNRGVGSLEESFDMVISKGRSFICVDNVRGSFNSSKIESFLTEDEYLARTPFLPPIQIDPRKTILLVTSNAAEFTKDFSNRTSAICLRKQPASYHFAEFAEGDLIAYVRTHQPRYLGAVFSVIKEWHSAGKPRNSTPNHDFRVWCQILDWIVTELLGEAPLMEGHRQIQKRTASPHLTWLRAVALAAGVQRRLGEWLRPNGVLDIVSEAGDIEIPGHKDGEDIENEDVRLKVYRAIGKRLGACFGGDGDLVDLGGYLVERRETPDEAGRTRKEYQFDLPHPTESSPSAPEVVPE